MSKRYLREVTYRCTKADCRNQQTLRYFEDDQPLPATNCVVCRAGFESQLSYGQMAAQGIGMLPIVKPVSVEW